MAKINTFFYLMIQGLKNILRNKIFSFASITTMVTCIFLFSGLFSVVMNLKYTVQRIEKEVPITVYFNNNVDDNKINDLKKKLENSYGVSKVQYVSGEDAWNSFKSVYFSDCPELADSFVNDNPLSHSNHFNVYVNQIESQNSIVQWIKSLDGIRKVQVSKIASDIMSNFKIFVGYGSITVIVLLLIVAILLISGTIKLGIIIRRKEIEIQKYIGATDFFVRAPFIFEGFIIGVLGSIIPLVIVYFSYNKIIMFVRHKLPLVLNITTFLPITSIYVQLVPICMILSIGIGLFVSFVTTKKYIRV